MEWRWGDASRLIFADGVALAGGNSGGNPSIPIRRSRALSTGWNEYSVAPGSTISRFEDVRRIFAARQQRAFSRAAFARCDPQSEALLSARS